MPKQSPRRSKLHRHEMPPLGRDPPSPPRPTHLPHPPSNALRHPPGPICELPTRNSSDTTLVSSPVALPCFCPPPNANRYSINRLILKQDLWLIPLCFFMHFLAYVDRPNITALSFKETRQTDNIIVMLITSPKAYSIIISMFFLAYALFAIPSNYCLKALGPSSWLAILLFGSGLTSLLIGFARSTWQLACLQFLLGMFEAGVVPGLVFYISFWYTREERATRLALILATAEFAGTFSGLAASTIMELNPNHQLSGWRWLLRMEGSLSMVTAVIVKIVLPDYPQSTHFLDISEKELALWRLRLFASHGSSRNVLWKNIVHVLGDWRLYVHYLIYSLKTIPLTSISVASPLLMRSIGYNSYDSQVMTIPPYIIALIVTYVGAMFCDKKNCRGTVCAYLMLVGATGFLFLGSLPVNSVAGRYIALIMAVVGSFATFPILLAWLSSNLHSTSTQSFAVGLCITLSIPAKALAVCLYPVSDFMSQQTWGHGINSLCLSVAAVFAVWLSWVYSRRTQINCENPILKRLWAC